MKIIIEPDCGNAPKMEFIKQFNIAFAEADVEFIIESITDDIVWHVVGEKTIEGKSGFQAVLDGMHAYKIKELVVENILSHGKKGAASGIIKQENGQTFAYSDFYEFSGAKGTKIKKITTFLIKMN